nr:F-box/kelch-repeat protein At3g23880-like [Coffea arabica]
MHSELQLGHIPFEIFWEILSHLPVKSLLKFKAVCKSWYALICDKKFVLSNYEGRKRGGALIFKREARDSCSIEVNYSINHELVIEKIVPCPLGLGLVKILGSSNGLVLFCDNKFMYAWNPSTRTCKELSSLRGLELESIWSIKASGFCYDNSSDDYNVVLVKEEEIMSLSLKSRKNWTTVATCAYEILSSISAIAPIVNGNPHWLANHKKSDRNIHGELIVYFDTKTNDLIELPVPELRNTEEKWISGLGVVDGCLCMIRPNNDQGEVLVMKEYGVGESWTTIFGFPPRLQLTKGLEPIFFTKNGDVLFAHGSKHAWAFNPKKESVLHLVQLPKKPTNFSMQYYDVFGCTYVESLAPIPN